MVAKPNGDFIYFDRRSWRSERGAAAGYDHVLLADSKFSRLAEMPRSYFQNCDRVKRIAKELKIQIVPAEFPIGYSNDLLSVDPNLAEGLPVRDTLFVVHNGEAQCVADPPVALAKPAWKDADVQIDQSVATVQNNADNARFVYKLTVAPFRCFNWDESCQSRHQTPGQLLAQNLRQCTRLVQPRQAYVWNDYSQLEAFARLSRGSTRPMQGSPQRRGGRRENLDTPFNPGRLGK